MTENHRSSDVTDDEEADRTKVSRKAGQMWKECDTS